MSAKCVGGKYMPNRPLYNQDATEILSDLKTDRHHGLSQDAATALLEKNGYNQLKEFFFQAEDGIRDLLS